MSGEEGEVVRCLALVAIVMMPSIGLATSEMPPVEPVKSETTKQLVFSEDQTQDTLPASTQAQPASPTTPKKHRAKKVKIKTKRQV